MGKNEMIDRLVSRKLAAGSQPIGCVPCFGIGGPGHGRLAGEPKPAQAAPKK